MERSKTKLVHLKGCEGCGNTCQWRSLNSTDGGINNLFPCNTQNFK